MVVHVSKHETELSEVEFFRQFIRPLIHEDALIYLGHICELVAFLF